MPSPRDWGPGLGLAGCRTSFVQWALLLPSCMEAEGPVCSAYHEEGALKRLQQQAGL